MKTALLIGILAAFSTTGVPRHLLTAIYGNGGAITPTPNPSIAPVTTQAQYLSWVYTGTNGGRDWIALYNAAGVKTLTYTSFWRNYQSEGTWYTDLAPGGAHAGAEATDCTKNPITPGGVYLNDPRTGAPSLAHANYVTHLMSSEYTALVVDNVAVVGGMAGLPCAYRYNGNFIPATNTINAQVTTSAGRIAQLFMNTINGWWVDNDGTDGWVDSTKLSAPANVLGLMCEQCFIRHTQSTTSGKIVGAAWMSLENAEISMVQKHKIFWAYGNSTCAPANSTLGLDQRMYQLTSALLSYDPAYLMFEECFATTPSNFLVMPETQFVPEMPSVTATSNVLTYLVNGNLYARRFSDCYYKGARVGSCAVLVNPSGSSYAVPATIYSAYATRIAFAGNGVLDGGSLSFTAAKFSLVGPFSGEVLIGK